MPPIPTPANEQERLATLERHDILDTRPEEAFDQIAELAREIFQVEKAAVSFVGRERQWFKATCGWDLQETDREHSFCAYTIMNEAVMVVEDARQDPRFAENPLVGGTGGLCFYAGAAISIKDHRVGALCVADPEPRSFSDRERGILARLAGRIEREIGIRQERYQLSYLTSAVEEAEEIVLITEAEPLSDPGPRIVYVNPAFTEITGYTRSEAIGATPRILQGPDTSRETLDEVREALEARESIEVELLNYTKTGESYWLEMSIAPIFDKEGRCRHFVAIERDVTARKQREEQIRLLNRIHQHDLRRDVTTARGWADLLTDHRDNEVRQRAGRIVQAADHMAETLESSGVVLEALQQGQQMEVGPTEMGPVLERALEVARLRFPEAVIDVKMPAELPLVQANELLESVFENLLANAVRHHDRGDPQIEVRVRHSENCVEVEVADDGPGIPEPQRQELFEEGRRGLDSKGMGLGLYLVDTLLRHYGGEVAVRPNQPRGTVFLVAIPVWER